MKPGVKPIIYKGLPWLVLGSVILPALATTAVGILILVFWDGAEDIALGVLTLCFAAFMLAGAATTLHLLFRQNKLTRLQTGFIANVSHELRTPMASIRMYTETLKLDRARTREQRQECLEALEKETKRLEVLVERLLDFRHQSIKMGATPRDCVSPGDLVEAVVDALPPLERERVELLMEPKLPPVCVNQEEAFDAFLNLAMNALTHGGDGVVVVTVRSDAEGVAFHVRDTGPGISRREQRRVFKRFYRGEAGQDEKKTPGFGLGLAIVRRFAEAHAGTVSVKSAQGRGATFTIWLPAGENDQVVPVEVYRGRGGSECGCEGESELSEEEGPSKKKKRRESETG